ncbi:MAG: hypothetical protein OXF74_07300 [Rhodobacteraceae bacterium]|nr:hypothetical protein [Paracoccaceae bacterium]
MNTGGEARMSPLKAEELSELTDFHFTPADGEETYSESPGGMEMRSSQLQPHGEAEPAAMPDNGRDVPTKDAAEPVESIAAPGVETPEYSSTAPEDGTAEPERRQATHTMGGGAFSVHWRRLRFVAALSLAAGFGVFGYLAGLPGLLQSDEIPHPLQPPESSVEENNVAAMVAREPFALDTIPHAMPIEVASATPLQIHFRNAGADTVTRMITATELSAWELFLDGEAGVADAGGNLPVSQSADYSTGNSNPNSAPALHLAETGFDAIPHTPGITPGDGFMPELGAISVRPAEQGDALSQLKQRVAALETRLQAIEAKQIPVLPDVVQSGSILSWPSPEHRRGVGTTPRARDAYNLVTGNHVPGGREFQNQHVGGQLDGFGTILEIIPYPGGGRMLVTGQGSVYLSQPTQ